ncbi:RNA 2',3'-cyclic phosphodiesterase [Bartonella henselae]|uniref:RNA 2',3'-cyclic phosphodiesterase n=2 Tax=Bartonella henselae TaxID=38323 RepID=X5LY58_BARHN|nr:RNA 2',3'-cyclic phosphodiesterase [Bartonella henselae]ATP11708.1 2'-5' RNA ligase [Bartonella henselae]ETS09274.1 2'-5' RNA ligase [Bartonella henselae JK 50]ETS09431.1 2'-5' RNA ligase [Bartonella henselae JK 51]ETS09679.1 2'-5' RNA ligase [Bartonella henselae JK 42]ETS12707.1 2'-5' RNA ligase [Bartonella henselae JK 41]
MYRLFSALQIPQKTTQELISLQNGLPKAQWINPQNFHITLSFFGEIESLLADELIRAFDTIKLPPFVLHIKSFEIFSSENTPHSLVVRIEPCETLNLLHKKMQCIRNHLRLPPDERQFTPHITLARLLDIQPEDLSYYLSSRSNFSFPPFEVNNFVLLLSPSPSSNAPYIVKGSWRLQG